MQTKLDHFFKRSDKTPPKKNKDKKCFIYDPENTCAYFTQNPEVEDKFICAKSGLNLYYRKVDQENKTYYENKIPENTYDIPLLKSNLQKAVRRKDVSTAMQTTIILLSVDPTSLLRRLPIIFIEDVCLTDAFPIVVWMMMADKDYTLKDYDKRLILSIVASLCEIDEWYDNRGNLDGDQTYTHESLQSLPNADYLLSLYYRMLYGGMKGDMKMLNNAIGFYKDREIFHSELNDSYNYNLNETITIIPEAIDFHPYPYLLSYIKKCTDVEKDRVKELIWFAESGVNVRKPYTLENREKYTNQEEWSMVKKSLDGFRERKMCKA